MSAAAGAAMPDGPTQLLHDLSFGTLADAIPALVWVSDAAGRWVYANDRWRQLTGRDPARLLDDGWREGVHPDDLGGVLDAAGRALAGGAGFEAEYRLRTAAGVERWMLARAVPRRAADGAFLGHVGTCVDITEERRAAQELRESRELLETIIACAPVGFGLLDRGMRFIRVNEALAGVHGIPADDHVGRRPAELPPGPSDRQLTAAFRRVLDTGEPIAKAEMAGDPLTAAGRERHWIVSLYPVRHEGGIVGVGMFVTDISDRVDAERGLQLLSDVGEALDATLGVEERLARLADILVPAVADFCTIDTLDEDGRPRTVASAHRDPRGAELLGTLRSRASADGDAILGIGRALRSGAPDVSIEISRAQLEAAAAASAQREAILELEPRSAIAVPLRARGRVLGALAVGMGPSGRRYDERAVALARQLSRRGGMALDNARLYEEQQRIAGTLQRSLLPPGLPEISGLEVAARYSPMGDGREVGGDFYDLFEAGDAWAAVIGDVCGKGAEAAALTSLARHGVRTLGRDDPPPAEALSELNEVIVRERGLEPRFSTVAYARLEAAGGVVTATVASAGHPLPLVVRAHGLVEPLGRPGTLIGPFPSIRVSEESARLSAGDALVLFTDGVTEARREGEVFGDERLRRLLVGLAGRSADQIAGGIEEAVVAHHGGPLADDLAVLVVRVAE